VGGGLTNEKKLEGCDGPKRSVRVVRVVQKRSGLRGRWRWFLQDFAREKVIRSVCWWTLSLGGSFDRAWRARLVAEAKESRAGQGCCYCLLGGGLT
jgi:hypothetical protein